jgi:hypothetical protein
MERPIVRTQLCPRVLAGVQGPSVEASRPPNNRFPGLGLPTISCGKQGTVPRGHVCRDSLTSAKRYFARARRNERAWEESGLLGSLVDRPTVFRRNQIGWISAGSWRSRAKADDIAKLKRAKRELDARLIGEAAGLMATLVYQLRGDRAANAVTCVPCGHSRRPDCLGKQIGQAVADTLGLPFLQVFADRPCSGVSHPKEFAKLPKLEQIADPLPSMILVDDLATSGWHDKARKTAHLSITLAMPRELESVSSSSMRNAE